MLKTLAITDLLMALLFQGNATSFWMLVVLSLLMFAADCYFTLWEAHYKARSEYLDSCDEPPTASQVMMLEQYWLGNRNA